MATKTSTFGFTGTQLKLIAMVLMTIDHVGMLLLPQVRVLRIIGRWAMPVFAWMIAEGCCHTKNRLRYFLTIAGLALIMQLVEFIFRDSLQQCVLVSFSLSILMIYTVDLAVKKQNFLTVFLMGIVFCCVVYICQFMPVPGFHVDYGIMGVMLPVAIYLGRNKAEKLFLAAVLLCGVAMTSSMPDIQWYALPSLLLLAFYNGRRGKNGMKYLFYIYYPLHLVVIYAISLLLY